jgi:hypothetical protein
MKLNRIIFAGIVAVVFAVAGNPALGDEEFVGPLDGWKNVKTDYGAIGDGRADDTVAIQKALDDLRLHKDSCVLYFPAGKYRITGTIKTVRKAHTDCMGVTIVGEDPATTVLRWDGKPRGMMLKYDAWYSKISRLTLDGAGKADVALAYGNAFSTYNETSDMVFQNAGAGMSMATADNGQAENEVLRCTFRRCSRGLQTNNFNSMDIWAWYCRFEDCDYGLYNGAGNFHAYQCLFLRSKKADIASVNLMVFSFVGNTSFGSNCFLDFAGGHSWGSPTSISGNRIIEPTGDFAIRLGNGGPYLVMDNVIKSRPGSDKPALVMTWGDQALVGNTYTVANPVKEAGRCVRYAEKIVAPETVSSDPPMLPPTPPRRDRKVWELPATASATVIQKAIDEAAKLVRRHAQVHLPKGTYKIDRTIVIPPDCDVPVVGDGAAETATVLQWTGTGAGPIFRLEGLSRATLRDLSLQAGRAAGIVVEGCDQLGGKVFCDQLNVSGRSPQENGGGVVLAGVEQSDVLLRCLQGGTFCRKWVSVLGGSLRQAGKPAPGQVSVLCGATGTAEAQYHVARGGRLVVRSVYHEVSGDSPQGILLDDAGSLSVDATRFSYKTSPEKPLVQVRDFQGQFALMTSMLLPVGTAFPARIDIAGDGARCGVLCLGNMFWAPCKDVDADGVWRDTSKPPAKAMMLECNLNGGDESKLKNGFGRLDNRGKVDEQAVLNMLRPLREARIWSPQPVAPGATDVRLQRVICTTGKGESCVELRAQSGPSRFGARNNATCLEIPDTGQERRRPQSGWCGEAAIQMAMSYYGAYASQQAINRAGKPQHPDLYAHEIPVAMRNLGLEFTAWQGKGLPAFLKWLQGELADGHPVLLGMKVWNL